MRDRTDHTYERQTALMTDRKYKITEGQNILEMIWVDPTDGRQDKPN